MQFEELQRQWRQLDEKLDRSLKQQETLIRQATMPPTRRRINRLNVWAVIDIAFSVVVMLFAGSFAGDHWGQWALFASAIVVLLGAGALLIESVRQLVQITRIDWDGQLMEIQHALWRLRIARIVQFKWIMLTSPLVGFCALIVGLQWLLDRLPLQPRILEELNSRWVIGNLVFGILLIPIGYVVIRYLSARYAGRGWWKYFLDGVSGTTIQQAKQEVDRWTALGAEAGK